LAYFAAIDNLLYSFVPQVAKEIGLAAQQSSRLKTNGFE